MNEEKREKITNKIQEFTLFDDEFMTAVFNKNIESTELLLRIILEQNLKVTEVLTQYVVHNLYGHSIKMDIHAIGENGQEMDIEVQKDNSGAVPKRARYNSSLIDGNCLEAGKDYNKLPESWIIFITENDVLEGNLPIYHIERMIVETGQSFDDKAHIIYVNGAMEGDTPLGKLVHDFKCKEPDDMNYKELRNRANYYKKDEEGVERMSKIMQELVNEAVDEDRKSSAVKLLKLNKLSKEEIADTTGLTLDVVAELAEKLEPVALV